MTQRGLYSGGGYLAGDRGDGSLSLKRALQERTIHLMAGSTVAGPLTVVCFYWVFDGQVAPVLNVGWLVLSLMVYGGMLASVLLHAKGWLPTAAARHVLTFNALATGLVWASAMVLFFNPDDPTRMMLVVGTAAAVVGIGHTVFAGHIVLAVAHMWLAGGALVVMATSGPAPVFPVLAVLGCVFLGLMTVTCIRLTRELRDSHLALHELAAGERRFRDIAEAASEWFWESDADHRMLYVSGSAVAYRTTLQNNVLGYTREETVGRDVVENPERWKPYFDAIKAHKPYKDFVYPFPNPGGAPIWVSISGKPVFDDHGVFQGYRGVGQDITEQLKARERTEEAQRRLRDAVDVFPGAFFLFDAQERMVLCNATARDWYPQLIDLMDSKASVEEMTRRYQEACWEGGNRSRSVDEWVRRRMREFHAPGEPRIHRNADGRSIMMYEKRTAEGGMVSVHTDISEMISAQSEAAQASRTKSDFLANVSHELRTPLNAIIGFADVMIHEISGPLGAPIYGEYIEHIHESGRHLLGVINDILDVSAIEAGRLELHEETVNICDALETCLTFVGNRAEQGGVILQNDVPNNLPLMKVDDRRVKQVLTNLLANAVKFTDPGGRVTVSGGVLPDGALEIQVSDTGTGMTEEEISLAMSPFGRAASSVAKKKEGTGLGLPLSKRLMDVHGGALSIDSRPDEGTSVTVVFPPERVLCEDSDSARKQTDGALLI